MNVQLEQKIAFSILFLCTLLVVVPVLIILVIIFVKGASALSLNFLLRCPQAE